MNKTTSYTWDQYQLKLLADERMRQAKITKMDVFFHAYTKKR